MTTVNITKIDEVFLRIDCDDTGILYELSEHFTFDVPGARYTPKYKMKLWDGKIRLFNLVRRSIYVGLLSQVKEFCKKREYPLCENVVHDNDITPEELKEFVESLDVHSGGKKIQVRDYQYAAVYASLKNKRRTVLSPTGSGKSLIQYIIVRYLISRGVRCMLIVPTVSLVQQMVGDFKDYSSTNGWDVDANIHMISAGRDKNTRMPLRITTWQSVHKQDVSYFSDIDAILCDEVHLASASSITGIMEKAKNASWRMGFTGSLDNSKTNIMVIQGLFGDVTKVVSTKELMDSGHLADMTIKCLVLKYNNDSKKLVRPMDYATERDFIVAHDKRNKFIRNLAISLSGNTLILYTLVEKHGDVLHKLLQEKIGDRKLFYVHGGVDAEEREEVRHITEESDDAIILASVGTMSTGTNIKRLHNIIFASPTKSIVRVLQSLGRGLRKAHDKDKVKVFDIADCIYVTKKDCNFSYSHFKDRLGIYTKEQFDYNIKELMIE